jgi:hypothetical protein
MKYIVFSILVFACIEFCGAQKYLAIDRYRFGTMKRLPLYKGEVLKCKTKNGEIRKGTVIEMNDSVLVFEKGDFVTLNEIKIIYHNRFLIRELRYILSVAGAGFMGLDAVNNILNNEQPIFKERALIIGGSILIAGQLMRLVQIKRFRIGDKVRLHVMDTNIK